MATVNSTIPKASWTKATLWGASFRLTAASGSLWWRIASNSAVPTEKNGHFLATRETVHFDTQFHPIGPDQSLYVRAVGDELTEIAIDRWGYYDEQPALP